MEGPPGREAQQAGKDGGEERSWRRGEDEKWKVSERSGVARGGECSVNEQQNGGTHKEKKRTESNKGERIIITVVVVASVVSVLLPLNTISSSSPFVAAAGPPLLHCFEVVRLWSGRRSRREIITVGTRLGCGRRQRRGRRNTKRPAHATASDYLNLSSASSRRIDIQAATGAGQL